MSDSRAGHCGEQERDPWGDNIRGSHDVGDDPGVDAHGPRLGEQHGSSPRG